MRERFLKGERPLLVCMVQAKTPKRIKELVTLSKKAGAEAFGMQFSRLPNDRKGCELYRELFETASPLPVYVTNYRGHPCNFNMGKDDDTLAKEILDIARSGATLVDVMGDLFDPSPDELTMNETAKEKQRRLIDELHAAGADVLMSSHVHKFLPADRVVEMALEIQSRGVDICKIVTAASTIEEELENIRITALLKKTLKIPFLFLAEGESRISRRLGAAVGNCMSLCVYEHDECSTKEQPLLSDMKQIRELI